MTMDHKVDAFYAAKPTDHRGHALEKPEGRFSMAELPEPLKTEVRFLFGSLRPGLPWVRVGAPEGLWRDLSHTCRNLWADLSHTCRSHASARGDLLCFALRVQPPVGSSRGFFWEKLSCPSTLSA